jgi:hypothetical protein
MLKMRATIGIISDRARSLPDGMDRDLARPAPVVITAWPLVPVSVLERFRHLQRDATTI